MAGEKEKKAKPASKPTSIEWDVKDIIIVLIVILSLWNVLPSFPKYLSELPRDTFLGRLDSLFRGNGSGLPEFKGVGADVSSNGDTNIYDTPGGAIIGVQKDGAKGKVVEGPVKVGGENYWKVDYEDGTDGWVKESDLTWPPANRAVDSPVKTYKPTSVYDGANGNFLGEQPEGVKGKVIDGPIQIGGENWWKIDFESGVDGWVKESDLAWLTPTNSVGTPIETKKDTEFYSTPGEGLLGSKSPGSTGKIIGGPVYKNGEWWWNVEFDDGNTGWVRASDIGEGSTPRSMVGKIFDTTIFVLKIVALVVSIIFISAVIYTVIKSSEVGSIISKSVAVDPEAKTLANGKADVSPQNKKWARVNEHIQSENPGDWRLAILECDIILAEMLEKMGYVGDSVGEILKGIEKSDFTSIEAAWEAHRVRNIIAHEGSDFMLSKREAERIVTLYRQVFEEFKFI
jgi:hypothetical protein